VWIWVAHLPGDRRAQLVRTGAGSVAVFGTIFTAITVLSGVGLGWIPALNAPSLIVNWMSLPTAAGELTHALAAPFGHLSDGVFILVCRLLGSAVFVAIFARQWWLARDGGPAVIPRAAVALLWAALLAPATLPWYFTWSLVLGAALPWPRRSLAWAVAASTWLVLCTYPTGQSAFNDWPYQLGMVAASLVAGAAVLRRDALDLHDDRQRSDPVSVEAA
ncbi:MAG: polyprenol phosphomannose-dependent alpha 1,6 mannosyltransferase MptB, partial [Pseudonocardiaceae bacterium]